MRRKSRKWPFIGVGFGRDTFVRNLYLCSTHWHEYALSIVYSKVNIIGESRIATAACGRQRQFGKTKMAVSENVITNCFNFLCNSAIKTNKG